MRSILPFLRPLNFPLSRKNRMPDRFVDPQLRSSTLVSTAMVLERLDTTRNAVHNDYGIETLYEKLLLFHSYIFLAFSI